MLPLILFYLFGTILVAAALGVILSRNPVYAALFLVLCFINAAAIWLLIEAEFLAIVLVLVYVGAVMVLFLFVVMMLDIDLEQLRAGFTRFAWLGGVVAIAVVVEIVGVVAGHRMGVDVSQSAVPLAADYSNTQALGQLLYSDYVYPLELAAMLLLVAIVAAITLTLRRRTDVRRQNIPAQVAATPVGRVRLVNMAPSDTTPAGSATEEGSKPT